MKEIILSGVLIVMAFVASSQNDDRAAYIEKYRQVAIEEMDKSGIPASIKLAQGLLESGAGTSTLARKANNHFGIKCGGRWEGDTYKHEDDDYENGVLIKSCFRKYKSALESYRAHTDFLLDNARYHSLFSIPKTNYKSWARGLKKAGYATSPTYADNLINLIERYELHRFDKMTAEVLVYEEQPKKPKWKRPKTEAPNNNRSTTLNNDIRTVIALAGDTYAKIADAYNISTSKLMKYNDYPMGRTLSAGEYVYLQPKRRKLRDRQLTHTVRANDDMYRISQKYGIRLECLYDRNRMKEGTEPQVGEEIYLRKKAKQPPRLLREQENAAPSTRPIPPQTRPTATQIYVVQKGDTLYKISAKYNMTVDELKQLNALTSDAIQIGQQLKVKR